MKFNDYNDNKFRIISDSSTEIEDYFIKTMRNNEKRLSIEEERLLFNEINKGNEQARQALIKSYSKDIVTLARCYMKYSEKVNIHDLIQVGFLTFIKAIDNYAFDGHRFMNYASFLIRRAILCEIFSQLRGNPISGSACNDIVSFKKAYVHLSNKLNREPMDSEIAEELKVSQEKLENIKKINEEVFSVECLIEKECQSSDSLIYDNGFQIEEICDDAQKKEIINKIIGDLEPKEQLIIKYKYGFMAGNVYTAKEIASLLGITTQRVYQIERRALEKIRNLIIRRKNKEYFEDYDRMAISKR